jgi:hypothetical protein
MSRNDMMMKVIFKFGLENPNTIEFSKIVEGSNMTEIRRSFEEIMSRSIFFED